MSETNRVERPVMPIAWAMPRTDGLVFDVICPKEHERYEGKYTLPLYALTHEQVRKLEERVEQRERVPADVALLQMSLDALEYHLDQTRPIERSSKAITALRARLGHNAGNKPPQVGLD